MQKRKSLFSFKGLIIIITIAALVIGSVYLYNNYKTSNLSRDNYYNKSGILKGKLLVKNGDLILRRGEDFISATASGFSQTDNTYSHSGIVLIENDTVFVYHSIGLGDSRESFVKRDLFEGFCDTRENLKIGIYRYNFTKEIINRLDSIVKNRYKNKLRFDSKFDLKTDDKQYCSEFIYKSILIASENTIKLPLSKKPNFTYIAVDNLYLNPYSKFIYKFEYVLK